MPNWKGPKICEKCGSIDPFGQDSFTGTHLTSGPGCYEGHKICNGKLVPFDRRKAQRRKDHSAERAAYIKGYMKRAHPKDDIALESAEIYAQEEYPDGT